MKLSDLKAADYNPRVDLKPEMQEYEKLKQSILEFGFVDPPIYNIQTGNLVGGHQRVAVAKELGLFNEIEVSIVDLPLDKEKALNLALNRISGEWDNEKLTLLLNEMNSDDINLTGFDSFEIENLLSIFDKPMDLEDFYEESEEIDQQEEKLKLTWKNHSICMSEHELDLLESKFFEYEESNSENGFVFWILEEKE